MALLALGALAVHQARYGLAIAAGAHEAGGGHRHAYLELLAPALVGATLAAVCLSLVAAAVRRRRPRSRLGLGVTERAALYAAGLVAVYVVQELFESLIAGHPGALATAFGTGSWLIVPLAMAFGAVAALVGRLLDRAEIKLSGTLRAPRLRAPRRLARPRSVPSLPLALQTLAFGLARRPPP